MMAATERASNPAAGVLLQAVIDSMPDSIALLDIDGTIRMVNQVWREFADANGLRSSDYCVNAN